MNEILGGIGLLALFIVGLVFVGSYVWLVATVSTNEDKLKAIIKAWNESDKLSKIETDDEE